MDANFANMRILLKKRRGVTLIEMLTVVSIIGVLATIGNVSYDEVRRLGRDVKRASDIKQMQTALELYFASHNSYPSDQNSGEEGLILGAIGATALDDGSGFTRAPKGVIYSRFPLGNPGPNGIPYFYRSLDINGNDCDKNCASYELRFVTEGKIAGLEPGLHVLTPLGILASDGLRQLSKPDTGTVIKDGAVVVGQETLNVVRGLIAETRVILDDPRVEKASSIAAPASVTIPLVGAAAAGAATLPQYFFAFITEPLLLLFRRKKKNWGVVYHSLTKLPVDLAIVRLYDESRNKFVRSTVTDREGRFSFLAPSGAYRIETLKPTLQFPSSVLSGARVDGRYGDLYFGGTLEISAKEPPHPNIPMDPREEDFTPKQVRRANLLRGIQHAASLIGPSVAAFTFASVPGLSSGAVFAFHILLYIFFQRLRGARRGRSFGAVYDEATKRPLAGAILRFYALPYHKLVETKISDSSGRYFFLVGPGEFYLTSEKSGFIRTQSDPIKIDNPSGTTITAPIPMRREGK